MQIFFLILAMCGAGRAAEKAPQFKEPLVVQSSGKAYVLESNEKKVPARKDLKLREKVWLVTEADGWLLVALRPQEHLMLAPRTRVMIPVISWEDGAVERIELQEGRMRLTNLSGTPRTVLTPITRDPYSEVDGIFSYDPANTEASLAVIEGRASFRGLENDESVLLEAGDEAHFRAKLENGEVATDVLLQGRRVVRGLLSPKVESPKTLVAEWKKAHDQVEGSRRRAQMKEQKEKQIVGAICQKPQGKLDQCAWVCEGNPKTERQKCRVERSGVKCVRRRCDANGRWSDAFTLTADQSRCVAQPRVDVCDY